MKPHVAELSVFITYFIALFIVIFFTYRRQRSDTDFVIGNRSLNYWLTALSAHASEMSGWLFTGYPALIFVTGVFHAWVLVGLVLFMYLNWQFIAPKIRKATEKWNDLTLNAYFESRFQDKTGVIRTLSACITFVFFLIYIAAGLIVLGFLVESLFGMNYHTGITIGLFIAVFFVYLGGYRTIAWLDLFQGTFLLFVILAICSILLKKFGGLSPIMQAISAQNLSTSLFPSFNASTIFDIILIASGWGLGYFGQPHIITKFMGINRVSALRKAKYVGISWQILSMGGATLIGLIGIYLFPQGLSNSEFVVMEVVKTTLPPVFAGLVLCAILAATTNVMAAQILVLASSFSEDIYKKLINKKATHTNILKMSRICVLVIAIISYGIAYCKFSTIYFLVRYAWSGIGAAFGPLVITSIYFKKINIKGAIAGILTGSVFSGIWPLFNKLLTKDISPIVPSFILSFLVIIITSYFTKKPKKKSLL